MKRTSQLILSFNEMKRHYEYIESLYIKRCCSNNNCKDILTIVLLETPNNVVGHKKLIINFDCVQQIKLVGMGAIASLDINIHDLTDAQMENIKYQVEEEEEGLFSFYCNSFSFKVEDI